MTSLCNVGSVGSIRGQGAKSPHASWPKKKTEQKQYFKKFNNDFKKWSTLKNKCKREMSQVNYEKSGTKEVPQQANSRDLDKRVYIF